MPPLPLHIDFESFSQANLKEVGIYRYAFDPSTEILCAAMALGDGEPVIWDSRDRYVEQPGLEPYWDALENPEVPIYAHNAAMEFAMLLAHSWGTLGIPAPAVERFRCTRSIAYRAALPGKLEQLGEVLNLSTVKDKRGKALIKKFSILQTAKKPTKKNPAGVPAYRIRPEDDPAAFLEFLEYCKQDVRVEQGVCRKLNYFDEQTGNANYTLHEIINSRGVAVNVEALRHAQTLIEEETRVVSAQFRELVGFEVTQNAKLLEWVNSHPEYNFPNLQAETIDTFLDPLEGKEDVDIVVQAMRMKQSIAYVSIKKVATMLDCVGPHDNRIRGMLNHHGATTGRSTASLVQFQNMKRPADHMAAETHKGSGLTWSEKAYREICEGISLQMLNLCYGPPLEVISSCIRHFVHDIKQDWTGNRCPDCKGYGENESTGKCVSCAGTGDEFAQIERPLHDADYSAIEGRIVNWLAGQQDAIDEYRDGVDRYSVMASVIYGVPVPEVNKHPQRFVGKQAILGCGFGMGPPKFRSTCWRMGRYVLPPGVEVAAVESFREKHKRVRSYWYEVENAAKRALLNKGQRVRVKAAGVRGPVLPDVTFLCADINGLTFLLLRLPSGRKLAYPRPRIVADRIAFFGNIQGKANWGDVETWGGKLVENITQAVAADIMLHGAGNAESKGYEIATLIHDQALSYSEPGQTSEEFVQLLTDLPEWAAGLPIEADGGFVPFYKKG